MRLSGRVVAVTGASAGIGLATAERLAREGAAVGLCARRVDRLAEVVARITSTGGRAAAWAGDVTVEADMRAFVARTIETFGRLDVMICNAGIGFHDAFDRTPSEVMRRLVDVNLMGTFFAARAALDVFLPQNSGHIIAVSSIVGRRGMAGSAVYSATKAAQIGFIEALRAEFVGTNLRASVVYPVGTQTEFHDAIERDYGHRVHGLGPRQSADDVARAIVECVVTPKAEVYPFPKAWWLSVLSVVAPARADRVVQKWGRKVER
jgi:NAD(P)-dependent dehydrogenase (short-subunit alcohol dehydrogenase family)